MLGWIRSTFCVAVVAAVGLSARAEGVGAPGAILGEFWRDIQGTAVDNLTGSADFGGVPSEFQLLKAFDIGENIGDNYGTRVRGYVLPPETGNYTFWIASDDSSELWLSDSENPSSKKKIAFVSEWTEARNWEKTPTQKSAPVSLQAGKRYYIEALQKEGGGGDNLAVAWQLPNGSKEQPIPGSRLAPCPAPKTAPETPIEVTVNTAVPTTPGFHSLTGTYTFRGKTYPFGFGIVLQEEYFKSNEKLPLIVSMHNVVNEVGGVTGGKEITYEGMGLLMLQDIGADNRHSGEWPSTKFNPRKDARFIGLLPHCPKDRSFASLPMAEVIVKTMGWMEKNLRVDGDRCYLTGFSYGGSCSWAVAQKFPERFAAIVPLSGRAAPTPEQSPEILKKVGVWCAVGEKDDAFSVACGKMAEEYKKANHPNFHFTVIKGGGHHCYQAVYGNPEFWKWLLAQKRKS